MRDVGGGIVVNITSGAGDLQPVVIDRSASPVRLGTLLAYADNVAIVNIDPGFTRTELVGMLADKNLVDAEFAAPMDLTVDRVVEVATSDDPLQYTGKLLRAQASDLDA